MKQTGRQRQARDTLNAPWYASGQTTRSRFEKPLVFAFTVGLMHRFEIDVIFAVGQIDC